MAIIGIIRESKKPYDKRVALSPEQCVDIMNSFTDVKIVVQPSPHRCISDDEYLEAGIEMSENLEHCDILLGIKEVPIEDLIANKKLEPKYFPFLKLGLV